MTEVKTLPDVWYTVTTENGCSIYRADGEKLLKEIEPGQGFFRAVENKVFCSDPDAIFRPFELAPRLKLTLLQGVAGGWLPKGFTELEYLKASGTQYIDTGMPGNNTSEIRCAFRVLYKTSIGQRTYGSYKDGKNITFYSSFGLGGNVRFGNTTQRLITEDGVDYSVTQNAKGVTVNGAFYPYSEVLPFVTYSTLYLFNINGFNSGEMLNGLLYNFEHIKDGKIAMSLRPVLNADGVPGMYDIVSKQFLENDGTGTFGYRIKGKEDEVTPWSLRDPYYVAPSGVYARKVGENKLEILADTEETSGAGWEWFANTAEAHEHFGIVPEEIEELLTE